LLQTGQIVNDNSCQKLLSETIPECRMDHRKNLQQNQILKSTYLCVMIIRAESTTRDTVTKALDTLGTDKVLGIVLNDVRQAPFAYYRYNYKYDYKPGTN
jgi:hypothetical protein